MSAGCLYTELGPNSLGPGADMETLAVSSPVRLRPPASLIPRTMRVWQAQGSQPPRRPHLYPVNTPAELGNRRD